MVGAAAGVARGVGRSRKVADPDRQGEPMTERRPYLAPADARVAAALAGAMLLLTAVGCQVTIEEKTGANPCKPDPCTTKLGVCGTVTAVCSVVNGKATCGAWKDAANKTAPKPAAYQAIEVTCDGKDNDCDGLIDEVPVPADPLKVCSGKGVCETALAAKVKPVAQCAAGAWQCDWSADPAWEVSETTCDGKDNDCDGVTDEGARPTLKTCARAGVCAGLPEPQCLAGTWACGYEEGAATRPADYQSAETKCDGKDNDCDGVADANLAGDVLKGTAPTCPDKGVCAGKVTLACKGGAVACDLAGVEKYEAFETSCDGVDNDCDGLTDNFQGGTQALVKADAKGCKALGVCAGAGAAVVLVCKAGVFACQYAAVPAYETTETTCDGKDNDCDGATDGIQAVKPAKSPCGSAGVCGGSGAADAIQCDLGLWTCNYAALGALGYEPFEQACDAKDNDCDGKTDETLGGAANKCKALGVCALGVGVSCKGGSPTCDYTGVVGYEDVTETACDGKDNDCDGLTDEADGLDLTKSPCGVGVCAGKAKQTCAAGKWTCDTTGTTGYEATETLCDGLDNDCDGKTDEAGVATASTCPTTGVCKTGVLATCFGGKSHCLYGAVVGYESTEASCDGLDNDCNGKTDAAICANGAACSDGSFCQSGFCQAVLGSAGKACVAKAGQCVRQDDAGLSTSVDDGQTACASTAAVATCQKGFWSAAAACPPESPACSAGACAICVAGATLCDPKDKQKVVKCAADGKTFEPATSCATGSHCTGAGACVQDGALTLSDKGAVGALGAVPFSDGSFVVVWLADGTASELRARLFGPDAKPKGPSVVVADKALKGGRFAIAPMAKGFGLAWPEGTATGTDILVRQYDTTAAPTAPALIVVGKDLGVQVQPTLAWNGTFFAAMWAGEGLDGDGKGIGLQKIDATGKLSGNLQVANSDTDSSTVEGEQSLPAITFRNANEPVACWLHGSGAKARLRGRAFKSTFAASGSVVDLTAEGALATAAAGLVLQKGELLLAWAASGADGAGAGLALRRFDVNLKAQAASATANTFTTGDQDWPGLTLLADGTALVAWQSPDAAAAGSGLDIAARDVLPGGGFGGAETVVTSAAPTGEQDMPTVIAFADGRVLYLFRHRATAGGDGEVRAIFR
ncbi:MAG: hypothetical protein EXR79_03720 [Myxococcales bacterium]|nr:hypothetical protein [Myxococcales bacterium]